MTFSKTLNSFRDRIAENFIFRSAVDNLIVLCLVVFDVHIPLIVVSTLFIKCMSTAGNFVPCIGRGNIRLGLTVTKTNNYELLVLLLLSTA